MKIEITIVDFEDQDHLQHVWTCDQHRPEFVGQLVGLLDRALRVVPPATVSLTVTGQDDGDDTLETRP